MPVRRYCSNVQGKPSPACATPRLILQLGSNERQLHFGSAASNDKKVKRARNAVRSNNAPQPASIAKPSMMLSYDSLETGTGSSNSLSSANESLRTNAQLCDVCRCGSVG